LNNAAKFTGKRGHIGLSVERLGDQAVIKIRDDGIGIAADQLARIFDMFVQVDTTLERSVTGLGIGLTLVKNLVELHGGTVDVQSPGIGQGSEFVVRLPVLTEPSAAPPPLPEPAAEPPAVALAQRVLIVDDNRDSADSLALLLELAGSQTRVAYDGLGALDEAAAFRPELVLLDIGLPRLNGYEVARRMRTQPGGESIMLVALTGWGQEEDRRRSKEAGFDGHLVKPVDPATLTRLLADLAQGGRAAD
jgi:CheY-like chemotaxis protein